MQETFYPPKDEVTKYLSDIVKSMVKVRLGQEDGALHHRELLVKLAFLRGGVASQPPC